MNQEESVLKDTASPYNKRIELTARGRPGICSHLAEGISLGKSRAGTPPEAGLPASPSGPCSQLIRALYGRNLKYKLSFENIFKSEGLNMTDNNLAKTKIYFTAMGAYWLVFGLITIFYPKLMDLFQTDSGVGAKTAFSDHVWLHGGFDIVALCVLLFALSRESVSRKIIRATGIVALMPTIAITYSLIATSYWNPLFIGAGLGCFTFAIWGFILARKFN